MTEILSLYPRTTNSVMLATNSISCGEPAEICTELERVDLNEFITGGQDGVYLIRAKGDSMEHDIRRGDLMIVNRNLQAAPGDVVVACLNGDYTVKFFQPKRGGLMLVPQNENYEPRLVTRRDDFEIFGIVTDVLRRVKKI